MFAYGDLRYNKMAREIFDESDTLKIKTLTELNEDFRRSDFITLALMSSDILNVLVHFLTHDSAKIRLLII